MRTPVIPLALLCITCAPAAAEMRVATRPGLGCASLDALAALTLPDGSSRVGTSREHPADADLKRRGGCVDIPRGASVLVQREWRHTARVAWNPRDGSGPRVVTMPTIDFDADATDGVSPNRQGGWRREGETYVWTPKD